MARRRIGVDVGGTKISVAILEDGRLSEPHLTRTDTSSTEALLAQIASVITAAAAGRDDAVVGLGIPCVIEFTTGRARYAANLPVVDVPLRDALSERTGLPVLVDNDATVAALAEACDDRGKMQFPDLAMLTVGTGIGGGVIAGGRIFRGATGAAPELGHLLIGLDLTDGAPAPGDDFPQDGSLERESAGRVLDALARRRGFDDGPAVVRAAEGGDEQAKDAVRILGERLGIGIANVIHAFEPAVVTIGGGASAAGALLLEPAERVARAWTLPGMGDRTDIRLARYGPQAGVRGAALLALMEGDD